MQIGLLWFDNDPHRALAAKVEEAANRYREKFGRLPDTCYVNHAELNGQDLSPALSAATRATLRIVPARNVLPHHFWVGVEEGTIN